MKVLQYNFQINSNFEFLHGNIPIEKYWGYVFIARLIGCHSSWLYIFNAKVILATAEGV